MSDLDKLLQGILCVMCGVFILTIGLVVAAIIFMVFVTNSLETILSIFGGST